MLEQLSMESKHGNNSPHPQTNPGCLPVSLCLHLSVCMSEGQVSCPLQPPSACSSLCPLLCLDNLGGCLMKKRMEGVRCMQESAQKKNNKKQKKLQSTFQSSAVSRSVVSCVCREDFALIQTSTLNSPRNTHRKVSQLHGTHRGGREGHRTKTLSV